MRINLLARPGWNLPIPCSAVCPALLMQGLLLPSEHKLQHVWRCRVLPGRGPACGCEAVSGSPQGCTDVRGGAEGGGLPVQLVEVMFRTAARLNVPLAWLPERLAEGNFNLEEPPERASPWVGVLLSHLATFRQKLGTAASLTPQDVSLVGPPPPSTAARSRAGHAPAHAAFAASGGA